MAKLIECNKGADCDFIHVQLGEGDPHTDPNVPVLSLTRDEYLELSNFFDPK
jgi:hypothetical protein